MRLCWLILALYILVFGYRLIFNGLTDGMAFDNDLDRHLLQKWGLVLLLISIVLAMKKTGEYGLQMAANWKTIPLYWPFLAILVLIVLGSPGIPDTSVVMQIFFLAIAVGIAEELMFRGAVIAWAKNHTKRQKIVISAAAFGGMHLFGLQSDIPALIILAQVYFAAGLGTIFAAARLRDYSILLPIIVHAVFDFIALSAAGGVKETFDQGPKIAIGMLVMGSLAWGWGLYLIKKAE